MVNVNRTVFYYSICNYKWSLITTGSIAWSVYHFLITLTKLNNKRVSVLMVPFGKGQKKSTTAFCALDALMFLGFRPNARPHWATTKKNIAIIMFLLILIGTYRTHDVLKGAEFKVNTITCFFFLLNNLHLNINKLSEQWWSTQIKQ